MPTEHSVVAALEKVSKIDLSPINNILQHENPGLWTDARVAATEANYRRLLALNILYPSEAHVVNKLIDDYWHQHILDTQKYAEDARLYRKGPGKEAKLSFIGHGLMENRSGLLVDACLTRADGHAERVAALHMIEPRADRPCTITLGADKAYDAEDFVNELRSMQVRPHVAQNNNGRSSVIDGRTTRHGGYAISQRLRKRIEEAFGWIKTVAGQEKTKLRGVDRVGFAFTFAAAAYNLVRLPKLLAQGG